MTVDRNGSRYTYHDVTFGSEAVADAQNDTLTSADMANFLATPVFKQAEGVVLGGPDQIVKIEQTVYDKAASAVTFSLGAYDIDLREENGVLYYPFATVSDLFSNPDVLTAYYADDKIYFEAMYQEINGGEARSENKDYLPWILEEERSADVIAFTYRELCFSVENFYGYPCTHSEFADAVREKGLDAAITAFDPHLKELLLSAKPAEYIAGLYRLFTVRLSDAGHTGADLNSIFTNAAYTAVVLPIFQQEGLYGQEEGVYVDKNRRMLQIHDTLSEQRLETLGTGGYYTQGDTAVISFDSFMVDYEAWGRYFSGTDDLLPDDTIGFVYRCVERADKDPAIRNVVFDLSTNGGGDTTALNAIVGLIRGTFHIHFDTVMGQQSIDQTIVTDRNFDGTIDDRDQAVRYDNLRFAVLSSGYTFSCANMMTALMKEGGFPVLGEQSGGGVCAVLVKATADGLPYRLSAYVRFATDTTNYPDDGIPADHSLVPTNAAGEKDYSGYYDIAAMSQAIERFYAEQDTSVLPQESKESSAESAAEPSAVSTDSSVVSLAESSADRSPSASSVPASTDTTAPQQADTSSNGLAVVLVILFGVIAAAAIAVTVVLLVKR